MKTSLIVIAIYLLLIGIAITGEVKCIIKALNCNWEPIGKAEVIYTASACTALGCIVGYIDIEDK